MTSENNFELAQEYEIILEESATCTKLHASAHKSLSKNFIHVVQRLVEDLALVQDLEGDDQDRGPGIEKIIFFHVLLLPCFLCSH